MGTRTLFTRDEMLVAIDISADVDSILMTKHDGPHPYAHVDDREVTLAISDSAVAFCATPEWYNGSPERYRQSAGAYEDDIRRAAKATLDRVLKVSQEVIT